MQDAGCSANDAAGWHLEAPKGRVKTIQLPVSGLQTRQRRH